MSRRAAGAKGGEFEAGAAVPALAVGHRGVQIDRRQADGDGRKLALAAALAADLPAGADRTEELVVLHVPVQAQEVS